jgi:tetratricopeptide (TPR) repeat protein
VNLEELLRQVLRAADEGDWEGAAELLREHVQEFEDAPEIHCWLGVAERELGLEGIAYERFKRALALDPDDPYVLATAGNAIAHFADPDAEAALRAAAVTAPELPLARFLYGAYLAREGMVEDALEELEAARSLDPSDPQIAYELGAARFLAGEVEPAADALGESVALDPDDPWARVVFGLVLREADRAEEAAGELSEAARAAPEDVEAQLLAALASASVGREDLAFEMMERARLRAGQGDQDLLLAVEEALDVGPEAADRLLRETLAPDTLRTRLRERP